MVNLSQDERIIIEKYPFKSVLDPLQGVLEEIEKLYALHRISYDGPIDGLDEAYQKAVTRLVAALQGTDAAFYLRSRSGSGNLVSEMARILGRVQEGDFIYTSYRPLVKLVTQKASDFDIWDAVLSLITAASRATPPPRPIAPFKQTPWSHNTSSFANSTEYPKYVDDVLKEELGDFHVDIPGFLEAYFGNILGLDSIASAVLNECKEGDAPLYHEEKGWRDWPESAVEKKVLTWLEDIIDELVQFAEAHDSAQKVDRRPLAQPTRPLEGSVAPRKLDIGSVNDPNATKDSKCRWSQILVPGELKNDRKYDSPSSAWLDLARYAREVLAAQDSRRFVLGFTFCGPIFPLV